MYYIYQKDAQDDLISMVIFEQLNLMAKLDKFYILKDFEKVKQFNVIIPPALRLAASKILLLALPTH